MIEIKFTKNDVFYFVFLLNYKEIVKKRKNDFYQ